MGGLFSSPSTPPAPEPPKKVDPAEEERKRRLENIERRRRGPRAATNASARRFPQRKARRLVMKHDQTKTDIVPDKLIERYRRAKARRSQWEGHWRY